nr:MAG TPA: hypothetical protein [Caudoviricetes sp.]
MLAKTKKQAGESPATFSNIIVNQRGELCNI